MMFLLLAIILFFCSLLIFFDLTSVFLWKISIASTEYGHWLFIIPLIIALTCRFQNSVYGTATVISLVTAAIFLFPAFSAMSIARSLPQRFGHIFETRSAITETISPFSWKTLWLGSSISSAPFEKIVFTAAGGHELYFNFYRAQTLLPAPCVIVIHTGGWDSGSPDEFSAMNNLLASNGYAVAAVSYRFAPNHPWPAQKHDVAEAISFIKNNAAGLGVDPHLFVLFGRSAGGHIAEAAAYSEADSSIKGCIALYAPADLNFAYEHLSAEPDILNSRLLLEQLLGGSQTTAKEQYDDASPYRFVSSATPPTLLIHGEKDPLTWYRQSERLSKKLADHSVPNLYITLPWGTHAFDFNINGPGGQIARYAVIKFLSSVFR